MSTEENKAIIRRLLDELNKRNLGVIDECFAANFVRHAIDGKVMDKEGYKRMCSMILKNAPDIKFTVDDVIGEGDQVAFCFTMTWIDKTGVAGNPPTGKPFTMSEAYFTRFEGGKIVEFRNFQARPREA